MDIIVYATYGHYAVSVICTHIMSLGTIPGRGDIYSATSIEATRFLGDWTILKLRLVKKGKVINNNLTTGCLQGTNAGYHIGTGRW